MACQDPAYRWGSYCVCRVCFRRAAWPGIELTSRTQHAGQPAGEQGDRPVARNPRCGTGTTNAPAQNMGKRFDPQPACCQIEAGTCLEILSGVAVLRDFSEVVLELASFDPSTAHPAHTALGDGRSAFLAQKVRLDRSCARS